MSNRDIEPREEEIDLFEYWLVIRKYWVLITLLVVACTCGTFFWTQTFKKSYAVTTAISLGRIEIDGKVAPVTSLADIQQILNSASFINQIISSLKVDEKYYLLSLKEKLEAHAKDNTENVLLTYITPEPQVGIKIMEKLTEQLQKTYNRRAESARKTKDTEIKKLMEKIKGFEAKREQADLDIQQLQDDILQNNESLKIKTSIKNNDIQGLNSQVAYLKDRLKTLETDKKKILNQCDDLEKKLNSNATTSAPSPKPGQDTAMSGMLQANRQQQTLGLLASNYSRIQSLDKEIDVVQNRILTLNVQVGNSKEALKQLAMDTAKANSEINVKIQALKSKQDKEIGSQIEGVKDEITVLEIQRGMIEGIENVAAPGYLNIPLSSKRFLYLGTTLFASLALGFLGAFILEWKSRNLKYQDSENARPDRQRRSDFIATRS